MALKKMYAGRLSPVMPEVSMSLPLRLKPGPSRIYDMILGFEPPKTAPYRISPLTTSACRRAEHPLQPAASLSQSSITNARPPPPQRVPNMGSVTLDSEEYGILKLVLSSSIGCWLHIEGSGFSR
ncbi:hypothetical protein BC567DRAFT_206835 [Phyllosticta citribraziliensis]